MKPVCSRFIFIIALIVSNVCYAQVAYYDALTLSTYINGSGKFPVPATNCDSNAPDSTCIKFVEVVQLLRPYLSPTLQHASETDIADALRDPGNANFNPFLAPMLQSVTASSAFPAIAARLPSLTAKATSSLAGVDVTTFTQGLADFLVERAKEELNVAFFERLKSVLDAYPEFNTLFPHTKTFINNYEAWQYANLLGTLREAFDKDLKEILGNTIKLRELTSASCPGELSKNALNNCTTRMDDLSNFFKTDEGIGLLTALKLGDEFNSGGKIPDAFNAVVTPEFLLGIRFGGRTGIQSSFGSVLKLLNIVSLSLRSNEITRQYISNDEFKVLFTPVVNNYKQKIYLGLLYQQILNANIVINGVNLAEVLKQAAADTKPVIIYLKQIQTLANNVQTAYDQLLKDASEAKKDLSADRIAFYSTTMQLIAGIANVEIINPALTTPSGITDFIALTGRVLQVVEDIKSKNYNAALIELMTLIEQQIELHQKAMHSTTALFPQVQQFTAALLKYGSFAANVVNAKDPDEVKDAIKTIALPAGSASIKKHSNFNVSVNAYVGFVYGNDPDKTVKVATADGASKEVKLNGGRALAVYAPVGIALNWGLGWRRKNPWSVSAFFSMIDVGAMVGYRFTNDSTYSNTPKIKFENIFSPGANIAIGLPAVPVSVGVGIQRIAMLDRNPGTNQVSTIDFAGWRQPQFFIAVDIPLINLFTHKNTLLNTKRK